MRLAIPTPVASGLSPVTPGDLLYAVDRLRTLPAYKHRHLALGSKPEPTCGVCVALRERPDRLSDEERQAVDDLLAWHGCDGLRCGVIYGAAAVLAREFGIDKGERDDAREPR